MRIIRSSLVLTALAVAPAVAGPGIATARPTCAEVVEAVRRAGDTQLTLGGVPERIVRDRSFCDILEIAELRFLPTRDNPQCPVGYRCREPDYEGWNWD